MSTPAEPTARRNVEAVYGLAAAYAKELDAQLGTLNLFTKHTGEIGRVHEYYLRSVLRRFLPATLHVSTGFVALPDWTSTQLDILIHPTSVAPLFAVGDLVVADGVERPIAAVEVKTRLDKKEDLFGALDACLELKVRSHASDANPRWIRPFYALYAASGFTLDTLMAHMREWTDGKTVLELPHGRGFVPDVIYVRGAYACVNASGMSDVYVTVDLTSVGEGNGLLALMATLYKAIHLPTFNGPWWLEHWDPWGIRIGIEQEKPEWGRVVGWKKRSAAPALTPALEPT